MVLMAVGAVTFIATGCSKKQVVREEAAGKPLAALPAPAPVPAPKAEEDIDLANLRILFAFDDNNLSTKARANLQKLGGWMKRNPQVKIRIEGHTCNLGRLEYNLALGDRRANEAKKHLAGLGINPNRIAAVSYGEEKPMMPNLNESNRSKNRRAEFVKTK